jgi:PPK2 family polyphosphate:nucleotide phosphotransferase
MFTSKDLKRFRVAPGSKVDLAKYPTDWAGPKGAKKLRTSDLKHRAKAVLEKNREDLAEMQELVYASDTFSVLIILQAMDAAGKDGTIRHVMSGVNPQGCQVFSFKHPSAEELDHNFLWRYAKNLPERGRIGIFNRSYYEEVLVLKVHPQWVSKQLPDGNRGEPFWKARYDDINAFERHLTRNGTHILKFFLHLSKDEQRERFLDRLTDRDKQWKYSADDLSERKHWDDYQQAYADALAATSTDCAPWHVIPADRKYMARAIVSEIIVDSVRGLGLKYPTVPDDERRALAESLKQLEAEVHARKPGRHPKNRAGDGKRG